jgi:hypothetical protein
MGDNMSGTKHVPRKWLIAALVARAALAADGSCPVSITKVKRDSGLGDRITYCFSLKAINNSGKPISSLTLKAAAVDSKRFVHLLNYEYPIDNVGPGETKDGYFSSHRLLGSDYQGIKVWVNKIEYKDHTVWADDGARNCGSQDLKDKNLKTR